MSRLADYFVVVGYDHEKESEYSFLIRLGLLACALYDCISSRQSFKVFDYVQYSTIYLWGS